MKEAGYHQLLDYLSGQHFYHPKDEIRSYAQAARIYFVCRRKGITIRSTIDGLIAQIAIEHHVILLHDDVDFLHMAKVISDLKVSSA
ncbi:MAG: hypothetical protein R8J84_06590 [Mariprofundales bacterium]